MCEPDICAVPLRRIPHGLVDWLDEEWVIRQATPVSNRVYTRVRRDELRRAHRGRVQVWLREHDEQGEVVFRLSMRYIIGTAVLCWGAVAFLIAFLVLVGPSEWVMVEHAGRGEAAASHMVVGGFVVLGLVVFGTAAVTATFVVPAMRPRTIVTRQGVRSVRTSLRGEHVVFAAAWDSVVGVTATYTLRRFPMPDLLNVIVLAREAQLSPWRQRIQGRRWDNERAAGEGAAGGGAGSRVVEGDLPLMSKHRRRDILGFLVAVHERSRAPGTSQ
ncbi:hypothetical protein [Brevibacterium jeotgali]|uniref:Uncharacterized protein n=1 Tax=Brevibacterium jeotgali TaxID=1262550 RepID=A0A2H1L826_9MICO|nr:hypothetical protein [Brevibacterium jeotgali]TWC03387.1 hypothetical protein FB108_2113 [Brevibacterium jeotgali]SMY13051.1 hypothetical protein BJEO58_02659 [Brevibacterium jeotgali]